MRKLNKNKNKNKYNTNSLPFSKKPIIKNSSYYQKTHPTVSNSFKRIGEELKEKDTSQKLIPTSKSLDKVFRVPKNFINLKEKWEKLTIPSLPFSERKIESKEIRQKKLLLKRPDLKYHNNSMIKWLNLKYSDYVKQKSIQSLLLNGNGTNIESDYKPKSLEKYVNINPKYFYDDLTYNKILKLKEIFKKFYNNKNHKIDINGIINMFKKNNIHVNFQEIKHLFFKNDKNLNNKDEVMMDFYEFLNFAFSKDQDFRKFMRKIKKKYENSNSDGTLFLPMNLESVFDYFIKREKERSSVEIIENSIKEMDEAINGIKLEKEEFKKKYINEEKLSNTERNSNTVSLKNLKLFNNKKISNTPINDEKKEKKIKSPTKLKKFSSPIINDKKYLNTEVNNDVLNNINFIQLINEISNVYTFKEIEMSNFEKKINKNNIDLLQICKSNEKENFSHNHNRTISALNEVRRQLKINKLRKMNINNFEKYKDLKLTLYATKNEVSEMKMKNKSEKGLYDLFELRGFDGSKFFPVKDRKKNSQNISRPFTSTSRYNKSNKYNATISNYNEINLSANMKKNPKNIKKLCSRPNIKNNIPKIKKKYDYVPFELFI